MKFFLNNIKYKNILLSLLGVLLFLALVALLANTFLDRKLDKSNISLNNFSASIGEIISNNFNGLDVDIDSVELTKLKDLEGCCGIKLFAGSSTGKLLVAKEEDIEKVISNSDRVVSIHSEDEEILNLRKKFIKEGDVHSHPEWRNNECAMSSTRRVVKIAKR